MVTCAFCNKMIRTFFADGEERVDTKYWHQGVNRRFYVCDAKCGLAAHQIGWSNIIDRPETSYDILKHDRSRKDSET